MDSEPTTWRPVATADGSWTLAHPDHGQTCHSTAGAWLEARERYALPCRLGELAHDRTRAGDAVRLLDVGTGLGLNLAAALEALDGTGARLEAVTLERDPAVIFAGFELPAAATPDVERWHAPVRAALARALDGPDEPARLAGGGGTLRLVLGDARVTLSELAERDFDAVFLDPFSPAVEPDLWGEAFLREVALRMAPRAVLSTYTSSFVVRLALVRAGLSVGLGPRVGRKATGTLASPGAEIPPLDPRTARRLAARAP